MLCRCDDECNQIRLFCLEHAIAHRIQHVRAGMCYDPHVMIVESLCNMRSLNASRYDVLIVPSLPPDEELTRAYVLRCANSHPHCTFVLQDDDLDRMRKLFTFRAHFARARCEKEAYYVELRMSLTQGTEIESVFTDPMLFSED